MRDVFHRGAITPGLARKKRRAIFLRKSAIAGVVFLVVFILIIYGLHRPGINFQKITVSGTIVLKQSTVEQTVRDNLDGKYFYLVPRSNALFFPKGKIEEELYDNYKRIRSLEIKREGLTELFIAVSERSERYLWCGRTVIFSRTPENDCYFIDSGGYLFSKAPFYSGNVYLEFYGPLATGENSNPAGGTVLSESDFEKIIWLVESLDKIGLMSGMILTKTDGDFEIYLKERGKIIVSGKNDFVKNIENLKTALATEPLVTKMEKERVALEYFDLRFGNNVYYRFR